MSDNRESSVSIENAENCINVFVDCNKSYFSCVKKSEILPLSIPAGTRYIDAVILTGIPSDEVGYLSVNGIRKQKDDLASDGETIRPFPFIIAG